MRGYYQHLAQIRDHYAEVDQILSGELPSTIAHSFAPGYHLHVRSPQSSPRITAADADGSSQTPPAWLRRSSAWKSKQRGRSKTRDSDGDRSNDTDNGKHVDGYFGAVDGPRGSRQANTDEEAGERSGLLDPEERDRKKERTAKIALNGRSLQCT